ncbi:MAG: hypothetical protein WC343_08540 [Bacilli bacterium]|jgi:hypothetical protein
MNGINNDEFTLRHYELIKQDPMRLETYTVLLKAKECAVGLKEYNDIKQKLAEMIKASKKINFLNKMNQSFGIWISAYILRKYGYSKSFTDSLFNDLIIENHIDKECLILLKRILQGMKYEDYHELSNILLIVMSLDLVRDQSENEFDRRISIAYAALKGINTYYNTKNIEQEGINCINEDIKYLSSLISLRKKRK